MKEQEESPKRAKWNGGKQFIRNRVQINGYKDSQWHEKGHRKDKIQPVWNEDYIFDTLEGIISKLDEAEELINELEENVEKKITQSE